MSSTDDYILGHSMPKVKLEGSVDLGNLRLQHDDEVSAAISTAKRFGRALP